jgi:hypothetical protein
LVVALAIAIAALLLGGAAAVIVIVSGSDKPAHAAAAAPAAATSAPSRTVTIIERQSSSSSSGSTSSASSHSTKRTASHHPQVVEPAASSASSSSSSSSRTLARAEIKSMLGRHFANIRDGNFSSAFADLGASLGQSESAWTSDLRADGLYSFDLTVEPQLTSSTSGVANIVAFHTEADASGCKDWSGSWDVAKSGGRWLITKSNLSQTTVSCGE